MTDETPQQEALEPTAVEEPTPPEPTPTTDVSDADDFKPGSAELAVLDAQDVYRAFDRADEIMVLDELQGRMLSTYVYSFPSDGKELTDLSYEGVNEAVRTMNREGARIRISPQPPLVSEVEEDGKAYYRVMVYAEDTADGSGNWGTAVEPKLMQTRKKGLIWDKFALTKALNKAQRNAKKTLIPAEMRQALIATYLQDESRVRRLKSVAETTAEELPAAAVGDEADELREKCRAVYLEIREISKTHVTPGRFDSLFTSVDHSVEKMREFLKWLEGELKRAVELQDADSKKQKEAKADG